MQMTGEQRIAAPREKVWAALNDPDVLRQCIPGCQTLERDGEDRFNAVAEIKIGPIGARFKGDVELSEIDAPNGYTITGKGNGGVAGTARGGAKVRLSDDGAGTLVHYDVDAEVGGRMAQLGGPIIDATAKNLAAKFFNRFGEVVGGDTPATTVPTAAGPSAEPRPAPTAVAPTAQPTIASSTEPASRTTLWGWIVAVLAAVLAGYVLGLNQTSGGLIALVMALTLIVGAAAFELGRRGASR